jgi:hypothetical protein
VSSERSIGRFWQNHIDLVRCRAGQAAPREHTLALKWLINFGFVLPNPRTSQIIYDCDTKIMPN